MLRCAVQAKSGKGARKNGKIEDLKLDDESWPSISGTPLAPAGTQGGGTEPGSDAAAEAEGDAEGVETGEAAAQSAPATAPGADVSVLLTVSDEGEAASVSVAITAH